MGFPRRENAPRMCVRFSSPRITSPRRGQLHRVTESDRRISQAWLEDWEITGGKTKRLAPPVGMTKPAWKPLSRSMDSCEIAARELSLSFQLLLARRFFGATCLVKTRATNFRRTDQRLDDEGRFSSRTARFRPLEPRPIGLKMGTLACYFVRCVRRKAHCVCMRGANRPVSRSVAVDGGKFGG